MDAILGVGFVMWIGIDPIVVDTGILSQIRITHTCGARTLYESCGSTAFTYLTINSGDATINYDVYNYALHVL